MASISGFSSSAVDADYWRIKASEAAKALEQESRDFRNLENVLRRVIARLCVAGSGRTAPLDAILGRLSSVPSSKMGIAELEALFVPLADAVVALDQRPVDGATGEGATASPDARLISGDADVRRVLARVLDAVGRDTRLVPLVTEIQAQIAVPVLDGQLPLLLSDIADLVIRRINSVEAEKAEVEDLLAQITLRLDDLTEFLFPSQDLTYDHNASVPLFVKVRLSVCVCVCV